jgi:hypothetical protein
MMRFFGILDQKLSAFSLLFIAVNSSTNGSKNAVEKSATALDQCFACPNSKVSS